MEINNLESLDALVARKKLKRFTFNFSTFSESENEQWLRRISRYYFSCGCDTGTIFLMMGMIAIISLIAYRYVNSNSFTVSFQVIVVCIIVLMALSGIGKAVGLIVSKFLLTREIGCLKEALKNVKMQESGLRTLNSE
jgi:hypothetical protein